MRRLKLIFLLLLHLACTLLVQLVLFRLLLRENDPGFWPLMGQVLPALLACFADLILSCFLLKGICIGRTPYILLQFWDLILLCPVLVLAFFGLLSEGEGVRFGIGVLTLDLLLIIERSVSFVLFDPQHRAGEKD